MHLDKRDYEVADCAHAEAIELVSKYHYARGGANTSVYRHGLFHVERGMVGVALWMPPTKVCAQSVHDDWRGVLCLSRLVVAPGEPTNSASYLLGRSMRLIKADGRFHSLVTYADEWQGHRGQIYRATNWTYVGAKKRGPVYVDDNNRMVCRKAGPKSRTHEQMIALGYRCLGRSVKHKFIKRLREVS